MSNNRGNLIFGLIIVGIGVILLMNNIGYASVNVWRLMGRYWPLILVIIGLDYLLRSRPAERDGRPSGDHLFAWILVGLGILFISRNLGLVNFRLYRIWGLFWPIVIIVLGWTILRSSSTASGPTQWGIMGEARINPGQRLESGNYAAFMGGLVLDLSQVTDFDQDRILDISAFMGGADVKLPEGFRIECDGSAFLGSVEFLNEETGGFVGSRRFIREATVDGGKTLRIRCRAILGGVDIK